MGKYFGTDGIRGVAGAVLDAELAFKVGRAAAMVIEKKDEAQLKVLIAKDTRISCDMLEAALSAGLCSAGANVNLLGVLPTPAAAYLTIKTQADMGIVISASHNSYEHNGIKIFGGNGYKLSDALEEKIEHLVDHVEGIPEFVNGKFGCISQDHGFWTKEYVNYVASAAVGGRFKGRIAIDCANGAATETARLIFRQIGAEFEIGFDEPNGININEACGSTHLGYLEDMMKTGRFSLGIAFDGDADRCLIVDELGNTIDGDMMLCVLSKNMQEAGTLKGDGFVGTVVSNAGMEVFAKDNGMKFYRADVGDRNVLERMLELGCNLGGESSGHVIFSDEATTGDGQLTAVKFLNALTKSGKKASELVADIPRFPQVMPSFKLTGGAQQRDAIMAHPKLQTELLKYEKILDGNGRVFIRPSGTEPIIRVLVEAKTEQQATEIADHFLNVMGML
ncbi:MAG: phosphoglucosamine mutase [Oscillospiraceae bacterium]|nr:phosphoglucosamine mutase [Oscillospiraceae bacterium]